MRYDDGKGRKQKTNKYKVDILVTDFFQPRNEAIVYNSKVIENTFEVQGKDKWINLQPLVPEKPLDFLNYTRDLESKLRVFYSRCLAETIPVECSSTSF